MLFSRGQWAVFGVEPNTLGKFQKALSDPLTIFEVSQLAASITTKFQDRPQTGINPFGNPRLDEKLTDVEVISDISDLLKEMDEAEDGYLPTSDDIQMITDNLQFIGTEEDFSLGNNKYGLWMVENVYEDPTDPNSKKEQLSYTNMERPFKFLVKDEKKAIEEQVTAQATLNRSQFPVLVDFQHGRVYVASSNVDEVVAVGELLSKLGAKIFPLVWDFGKSSWPSDFLNKISDETHFASDMQKRAEQLAKFRPDEIEKLEDKQMEKIVSTFFALSKLENEIWVGLTTPARIRIHKPIDPVGVSNPSVAFSLLSMSNDAEVASAGVVFQEVVIKNTKNGEKLYRNDLYTIDINDNVNLQEAGAAMVRGFDLPQFKKEVKTTIKAKGRISIRDFWAMWLQGLHDSILGFIDNVTDVLEINKTKYGMVVPDFVSSDEVEVSEEV
jgi:hypothetical protein